MNNKLLSYKASLFHKQNIPPRWELLWEKFICCLYSSLPEFENVSSGVVRHFSRVLDYVFVFEDGGIKYLDAASRTLKPTNITIGGFTWAFMAWDKIWFGGAPNQGLWYSLPADPYTIMQTSVTTGTFTAASVGSTVGFYGGNTYFLSSNGGYNYNSSTGAISPSSMTIDFKNGIVPTSYLFGSTTNKGIYSGLTHIGETDGDFFAYHALPSGLSLIFGGFGGSDGVWKTYSSGHALTLVASDFLCYHAARGSDSDTYLCTDAGIKRYNYTNDVVTDTNITTGKFFYSAMGEDGFLYFCGEDGIYFLDYDGQIRHTGKSGNFRECVLGNDDKLYFADANGSLIRISPVDRGNTGYAVAAGLKIARVKYSKIEELGNYDILNDVSPQISGEKLRRMSKSEIDQRITSLWNSITKPDNLTLNNKYFTEEPVLCAIGNFGFRTKVIGTRVWLTYTGDTLFYTYGAPGTTWMGNTGPNFGFNPLYLDDVSFWKKGDNKIILQGGWRFSTSDRYYAAFIDYPPEEWSPKTVGVDYNKIRQAVLAAPHKARFSANTTSMDISRIYESDTAKTLVLCAEYDSHSALEFNSAKIIVNDEQLNWTMYVLLLFEWSNRACQTSGGGNTGNAIAKTLTMTQAVLDTVNTFNILAAFGSYDAISEPNYLSMSNEAISQRANALMDYAAAQKGQTKYKRNNEVIEYDISACPLTPVSVFTFADGSTSKNRVFDTRNGIAYNEAPFTDTITSTVDGSQSPVTVQSKPSWLSVAISGGTATITPDNNTGAYRDGTIVYEQTATGETIESQIGQYGAFSEPTLVLIGISKNPEFTTPYPGIPPEDYGVSCDFEIKIDGVSVRTGSRGLPIGDTRYGASFNVAEAESISGYNYAKTVEVFLSNPSVNYPGGTASIAFSNKASIGWWFNTKVEITGDKSAHITINHTGGTSSSGGAVLCPIVTILS
jgi:hypothetical protein